MRAEHPAAEAYTFRGGPLSNFARVAVVLACPFTTATREYPSVEHWFQASKATTLADHVAIASCATPLQAKQAGRAVKLRGDWEEVKFDVMLVGLRAKFSAPRFGDLLLATGEREIREDSPRDFEWGARDAEGGWTGRNLLGVALMIVRAEIRDLRKSQLSFDV